LGQVVYYCVRIGGDPDLFPDPRSALQTEIRMRITVLEVSLPLMIIVTRHSAPQIWLLMLIICAL